MVSTGITATGERTGLERRIMRKLGRAVGDFEMIAEGDRILVAVSGGKDSYTLLHVLEKLRRKSPISFSLVAVNIDQGFTGFRQDLIAAHLDSCGFEYNMCRRGIAKLIETKLKPTQTACALCSRLRRGVLYDLAPELDCNKIALGHHKDDLIETLLLNMFFAGELKSMPPLLRSDDGRNVVIRPLAYVDETYIAAYAALREFPLISCPCPARGVRDNKQRRAIKAMLEKLECRYPGLKSSILTSMRNPNPAELLDRSLMD